MTQASTASAETAAGGTDLERWQAAYEMLAPEVRDRWQLEQVRTIRNTVARDLSPAEFQMGMAIAAKYDLDPLLKEIWFAKGRSKNGNPGRLLIMVGRDGLLRNARRDVDYCGFDTDVVREKDLFRVRRLPDGSREIQHEYEGSAKARGPIVGAWAIVRQRGKPDTYFFAPMEEYMPSGAYDSTWKTQPSVMIQKCALSLCLRLAFNLSGVVGEDEGAQAVADLVRGGDVDDGAVTLERLEDEIPPDLRARFHAAWVGATETNPRHYSLQAAYMTLSGQPPERVVGYIESLERVVEAAATRRAEEAAEPPDAEVVPDDQPAGDLSGGGDRPASDASASTATGGELPGQPEEERPVVAAQDRPDVEQLRRRLSDLYDAVAVAEADPNAADRSVDDLNAQIDEVERELLAASGDIPGQAAMFDE